MANIKFSDFIRRVCEAGKTKKVGVAAAAKVLGISRQSLQGHKTRNTLPEKYIYKLAGDINVSHVWLLTGKGEMAKNPHPLNTLPFSTVPVLARVPAGFPNEVKEDVLEYITVPGIEVRAYAIVVHGDSMTPTLRDGDYVFFTVTTDINNGDVVVVKNEYGEAMIKRYKVMEKGGEVRLVSDNREYPDFTPTEDYNIIGKVIKGWRDINF